MRALSCVEQQTTLKGKLIGFPLLRLRISPSHGHGHGYFNYGHVVELWSVDAPTYGCGARSMSAQSGQERLPSNDRPGITLKGSLPFAANDFFPAYFLRRMSHWAKKRRLSKRLTYW